MSFGLLAAALAPSVATAAATPDDPSPEVGGPLDEGVALLDTVPVGAADCGEFQLRVDLEDAQTEPDDDGGALACFADALAAGGDVSVAWTVLLPEHPQRPAFGDRIVRHRHTVVAGEHVSIVGQPLAGPHASVTRRVCERTHVTGDGVPRCGGDSSDRHFTDVLLR